MKNTVTATIEFYFKGEKHTPSITLDLNQYIQHKTRLPSFYPLIAKANHYDLYSYEYEMMQAEPVQLSQIQGIIAEFIGDDLFDLANFQIALEQASILHQLHGIAKKYMQIEILSEHPKLKTALLEAYQSGQRNIE